MGSRSVQAHRSIMLALVAALAGCANDGSTASGDSGVVTVDSTAIDRIVAEANGEVAHDSAKPPADWLSDANALALASAMNNQELAAADAELGTWHVDTVRAFAAEMAREHSALQRTLDSAAGAFRIAPVAPALEALVQRRMQRQLDSVYAQGGKAFDRAYVGQQIASHQLMHEYLVRLAAIAQHPGLHDVLSTLADTVESQVDRARTMQTMIAAADSAAADSAAARAARAARRRARTRPEHAE